MHLFLTLLRLANNAIFHYLYIHVLIYRCHFRAINAFIKHFLNLFYLQIIFTEKKNTYIHNFPKITLLFRPSKLGICWN